MSKTIVLKVISKHLDHVEGTPLMCYKFEIVFDQFTEGRQGELVQKYYAKDPLLTVGKMYAMDQII